MKSLRTIVIITATATATLVVGGSVGAWAARSDSAPPSPQPTATVVPHLADPPVDTAVESKFTPISPCRIVDTRASGGPIGAGSTRAFFAAGTVGFPAQGGNAGGCGIPSSATAIAVTVISVGATGPGFVRVWAFGSAAPLSSFLNYANASAVTGAGNIPINGVGAHHFNVSANSHQTNVVVDVQGYFVAPMSAEVDGGGGLVHGSRVTGVIHISTGEYEVDFDRNVSHCTYNVSLFVNPFSIATEPRSGNVNGVFVYVQTPAGANTDDIFYLTVTC